MKKNKEEITLKDILDVFLKNIGIILIVAVVLSAAFGIYSGLFVKDTYTSSSTMFVFKDSMSPSSADLTTAQDMVEVYKVVIMSDDLLTLVLDKIPEKADSYGITVGFLKRAISLSSLGHGIFKISVTTGNSELSVEIARAVHDACLEKLPEYANSLEITSVEEPKIANSPNDKNIVINSVLGFFIGTFSAMLIIWIIHCFDVVIHDKKKIEDNFDIPVLGVIPVNTLSNDHSEEAV